jgi:KTSC domain
MLLKRDVTENIIKALYESSNILASIYNLSSFELIIIFKSGAQYKYANVSQTDYTRFETADSQGSVFNKHLKKYVFERLQDVDVDNVIKEANQLEAKEKDALMAAKRLKIFKCAKNIITLHENVPFNNDLFVEALKKIESEIKEYF